MHDRLNIFWLLCSIQERFMNTLFMAISKPDMNSGRMRINLNLEICMNEKERNQCEEEDEQNITVSVFGNLVSMVFQIVK